LATRELLDIVEKIYENGSLLKKDYDIKECRKQSPTNYNASKKP